MEDMLKKIIDMDEKARELKAKAQQDKAASEHEIEQAKQALYEDYLNKARERAKQNAQAEQESADKEWEQTKALYQKMSDSLEAEYAKNRDGWIDTIFNNVING